MPADETKSIKVTFAKSMPMGTRATFTVDKELWIAYPAKKVSRLHAVTTRLIGVLAAIGIDLLQLLNAHPEDAAHIMSMMTRMNRVEELKKEFSLELAQASTE